MTGEQVITFRRMTIATSSINNDIARKREMLRRLSRYNGVVDITTKP